MSGDDMGGREGVAKSMMAIFMFSGAACTSDRAQMRHTPRSPSPTDDVIRGHRPENSAAAINHYLSCSVNTQSLFVCVTGQMREGLCHYAIQTSPFNLRVTSSESFDSLCI